MLIGTCNYDCFNCFFVNTKRKNQKTNSETQKNICTSCLPASVATSQPSQPSPTTTSETQTMSTKEEHAEQELDQHTVRRINTALGFNNLGEKKEQSHKAYDPYRMLERSQSEAILLKKVHIEPDEDEDEPDVVQSAEELGLLDGSKHHNVSECTKVYYDLSKAEAYESFTDKGPNFMIRTASGRQLETIPQEEELQTTDMHCARYSLSERSVSMESTSSVSSLGSSLDEKSPRADKNFNLRSTSNKEELKSASFVAASSSCSSRKSMKTTRSQDHLARIARSNLKSTFQSYAQSLRQKMRPLHIGSTQEQITALREICILMEQVWAVPTYGRDLAYGLCDILKTEGSLDVIIRNCSSQSEAKDLLRGSARLLEKVLTTGNRHYVVENGLENVVKMTVETKGDTEMARVSTGILESLFKHSEDTCSRLNKLGGLDVVLYWCRCNDRLTLRHCAIALSNLALYGGPENQEIMTQQKVPEWLFPLAFNDDDSVRYYACLAIAVLVANKEIKVEVQNSGTLELVLPFIASHDPHEFARMDLSHRHGRSRDWLRRLVPVLSSKQEEAQSLAAFHFAMEAGIKSDQDKKDIFYEIEAIEPLRKLAGSPNATASKLAASALKLIGEELPHKLTQQVPLWSVMDVVAWLKQVSFGEYANKFEERKVDGDMLLKITAEDLCDSIGMSCLITQKRFLRELQDLMLAADYKSCDHTNLDDWLSDISPKFSQYTYKMIAAGADKQYLPSLTDEELNFDCGINNGIHRKKILQKIQLSKEIQLLNGRQSVDSTDGGFCKHTDVFISYRRANGSQLASLLKVHLQLRGFTVFLDIEKLRAGKFDESLLNSVSLAKHFVLVLTPDSLNRCIGDEEQKDWVHREIAAALKFGCNIIPVMDNFEWPSVDSLPEDMRQICYFNGIRWIHDYQDACVDKLERFLKGEINCGSKRGNIASMGSSLEGQYLKSPCKYSSSESTPSSEATTPNV